MNDVKGLDKLLSQFKKLKNIDPTPGLLASGNVLLRQSKKNAPVDTGFLRNSGDVIQNPNGTIEMIFSADYSYFVEVGTSHSKAHPYVRPAISSKRDKMIVAFANKIAKKLKEVKR